MVLVKPATVIQWHREGFRLNWRSRSGHVGRPKLDTETRDLIRQMSIRQSSVGAPWYPWRAAQARYHGQRSHRRPIHAVAAKVPSPTWRSFLHNHMSDTLAADMFVVATATFRLLYPAIVLGHDRRRIVHFNVTQNPTQLWLARQITEPFPWDPAPRNLLRDRDAAYGQAFRQNAYVERITGSVRRECLDHVIVFDECHLRGVLSSYFRYYNRTRTHLSLGAARYTDPLPEISSSSLGSVACTIVTNGARPNLFVATAGAKRVWRRGVFGDLPTRSLLRPKPGHKSVVAVPWYDSPDKELPVATVGRRIPWPSTFLSKDNYRKTADGTPAVSVI